LLKRKPKVSKQRDSSSGIEILAAAQVLLSLDTFGILTSQARKIPLFLANMNRGL
jgi:hypothetical protein